MILNFRSQLLLFLFTISSLFLGAQVDLFTETFDELDGSITGMSAEGVLWSSVCPTCVGGDYYEVVGGTFENNDSNGPATWTTDPMDISSCSRITVDIDYSGSPYGAELESNFDCSGCLGDPNNPFQAECMTCWDYIQFNINIDGVFTQMELIGTTNTASVFQVDWEDENCPNLGDLGFLQIVSQTWAAAEFMRFDNIAMVCHDDGGISATLSGGDALCPGECTDVTWDISGGTAPYNLVFELSSGPFSVTQGLPGLANMGDLTVCYDQSTVIPNFETGTNTLNIGDGFGTDFNLELISITDDSGCMVNLTGQEVNITLGTSPSITDIPDLVFCTDITGGITFNLDLYDIDIGGGNTVNWFSDAALMNSIGPSYTTLVNTTIYAVVEDVSGCMSPSIEINVSLDLTPNLDFVGDVQVCDFFVLPPISGQNLTGSASYFSGPNGTGTAFAPGAQINFNTTIFIFDENNGCPDEESFMITILPSPDLFPIMNAAGCGFYVLPEIFGDNLSGNQQYNDQPGGGGITYMEGDTIFTSTAIFATDVLGTCFDESFFVISITPGPVFDMPLFLSDCGSVTLPPIVGEGLTGNESYYTGTNGTGNMLPPGTVLSDTQLLYVYDANGNCIAEVSININVSDGPVLDPTQNVTVCDFYVLPDITGQNLFTPIYTDNNSNVYQAGDTIFQSIEILITDEDPNNTDCSVAASFEITILMGPDAGEDQVSSVCGTNTLDVTTLLESGIDDQGVFEDLNSTGAIIGNILNLSFVAADSIILVYILSNSCGADTSNYQVNIVNTAFAGTDQSDVVCEGNLVNLSDLVIDGDAGGAFVFVQNGEVISEILSDTIANYGNSVDVFYVVGDGVSCPRDSANITLNLIDMPTFDVVDTVVCGFLVLPNIEGVDLTGGEQYFSESDGMGSPIEIGDTVFSSTELFVFTDNGTCLAQDSFDIIISENSTSFINETICNDDTLFVNGIAYNIFNQSGTQPFTNQFGCDSNLIINVTFFETDTNFINLETCFGSSIVVNNVTYDESNPSGQQIYPFADMNACDSVIVVNLTFSEANITPINEMICENDSIDINGTFYSINNPFGMDTIFMPGECDSVLDISLTFLNASSSDIDTMICLGQSIMVNGNTYDIFNQVGTESITGGNSQGCDSLVSVQVSFFNVPDGELFGTFCGNEVVDTLGEQFDIDNPSQTVILPGASFNGCDSSVFVSFEFIETSEGLIEESICWGATINIEGTIYSQMNQTGQFTSQTVDGCDSITSVIVTIEEIPFDFEFGTLACDAESGYLLVTNLPTDEDMFFIGEFVNYNDLTLINIGDTVFNVDIGSNQAYILQTLEDCQGSMQFEIPIPDPITIDLIDLVVISEGEDHQVNLDVPANSTILWSPDVDISCTDCANPTFSPSSDMEYIVDITTPDGCFISDTIMFRVEQSLDIFIPNIFSPNDDGINDIFYLFSEASGVYDLFVYDRWGNKMFEGIELETNNLNQGWDGTFNGQVLKPGVYVYYLVYTQTPLSPEEPLVAPQMITGDITIIR